MSKLSKAELQKMLTDYKKIVNTQIEQITWLNKEIEQIHLKQGTVSKAEFDILLKEYNTLNERYNKLLLLYDEEKNTKKDSKPETGKDTSKRNPRGAGRKEYLDTETIQYIYSMYLSGKSLQLIADTLNDEGIATKAGGKWAKSSVRFILLNDTYVKKGIVDINTYNMMVERMKRKK